jgi:hypothetical protein
VMTVPCLATQNLVNILLLGLLGKHLCVLLKPCVNAMSEKNDGMEVRRTL